MSKVPPHRRVTPLVALCATLVLGCDAPEGEDGLDLVPREASPKANPPPSPFSMVGLFIADGVLAPGEPMLMSGDTSFFTDVMGWTAAQLDDWLAGNLAQAEVHWGIPDPANNPDILIQVATTNPSNHYRMVMHSDRKVPATGWRVREGSMSLIVINPAGIDLGGDYAGTHLPYGDVALTSGVYNIEVTDKHGDPTGEEIVYDFDAVEPMFLNPGSMLVYPTGFFCSLDSEELGEGKAQGSVALLPLPDGSMKLDTRNVVTFSALGGY